MGSGVPWVRSAPERWPKSLIYHSSSRSLFTFSQFILFYFSYLTGHRTPDSPPPYTFTSFGKDGCQSKGCQDSIRTYYGLVSPPFLTPLGVLLCRCNWEHLLDPRSDWSGRLFFLLKRDSTPAGFSLTYQRETRPNLLSLTSPSCSQPRGPSTSYLNRTLWNSSFSLNQSDKRIQKANTDHLKAKKLPQFVTKSTIPRKFVLLTERRTKSSLAPASFKKKKKKKKKSTYISNLIQA